MRWLALALFLLSCPLHLRALEPPTTQPATNPTTNPAVIQATDLETLKSKAGEMATVEGVVERATWSPAKKVMHIYFQGARDGFMCSVSEADKPKLDAAFDGNAEARFNGARLQVTGKISLLRDRPRIQIETPEQVTILPATGERPAVP